MNNYNWRLIFLACVLAGSGTAQAGHTSTHKSNVAATKHNLSATSTVSSVKATSEKQICVFCHTPHGASNTGAAAKAPLWNHGLSTASGYTRYSSDSLDAAFASENYAANQLNQPAPNSKLCLSCHDGTVAIGSVNVANGLGAQIIAMSGVSATGMMPDSAETTGFTARLGIDLTNDHPISVYYTTELVARDGELRTANASQQVISGSTTIVAPRFDGSKPLLPLTLLQGDTKATVQCNTCHDPHLAADPSSVGNQKFLRMERFQAAPPSATFTKATDIICLGCHEKGLGGTGGASWAYSVHGNEKVTNANGIYTYTATAATLRDFPADLPVWKAACLNCHDTHTVQGASRLLREGTNENVVSPKPGGAAAQEETCYQCHAYSRGNVSAVNAGSVFSLTPSPTMPQDIYKDFTKTIRMPITTAAQGTGGNTSEIHNIGTGTTPFPNFTAPEGGTDCTTTNTANKCGADFMEPASKLGKGNLNNRHAECTDCHNPHRMVRFQNAFPTLTTLNSTVDATGTHIHTDTAGVNHTNVISGVLRGTFGVEPAFNPDASFFMKPDSYVVKRGDPGTSTGIITNCATTGLSDSTDKVNCNGKTYVTREYQICLKCHSDYAYDDNNLPDGDPSNSRPALPISSGAGLTQSGTNGLTRYSSVAREMQAPPSHRGEVSTTDSGAYPGATAPNPAAPNPTGISSYPVNFLTNNHRSWKPVLDSTGRTLAIRGNADPTLWNYPWSNNVGNQTMYCSDCHGSTTPAGTAIPATGENWGPHGSQNIFLLKGILDRCTGSDGGNTLKNCQSTPEAAEELVDKTRVTTDGDLCFKCHNKSLYTGNSATTSGFSGALVGGNTNLHGFHNGKTGGVRCTWCHIAVTHGWKNKAFLVNLNDVGPEVMCRQKDVEDGVLCTQGQPMPQGTQVRNGPLPQPGGSTDTSYWGNTGYTNPPYYLNAMLKIINFKPSGKWVRGDIGSVGAPGNGLNGDFGSGCGGWMSDGGANTEFCSSPP